MAGYFQSKDKLRLKFIAKAIRIHGYRYDYSKVVYDHVHRDVEIICKIHDSFWQTPSNHTNNKAGCRECSTDKNSSKRRFTKKLFIEKSVLVHGDTYDYSLVVYKNIDTAVDIICKNHGPFPQTPYHHMKGGNCPLCAGSRNVSLAENIWIKSFNNANIICQYIIQFNEHQKIKVDGFDPTTNTVYEYHGKYWHGHPDKSDPEFIIRGKSAGDRYIETLIREIRLKEMGYNVISIWG